ncbi:hypothetical protein C8Q76DRAFT_782469 [Earliella scabrosa]|nr:hypothetical protein C8Q76DRAFT_782469 [Earliella scabrosa]
MTVSKPKRPGPKQTIPNRLMVGSDQKIVSYVAVWGIRYFQPPLPALKRRRRKPAAKKPQANQKTRSRPTLLPVPSSASFGCTSTSTAPVTHSPPSLPPPPPPSMDTPSSTLNTRNRSPVITSDLELCNAGAIEGALVALAQRMSLTKAMRDGVKLGVDNPHTPGNQDHRLQSQPDEPAPRAAQAFSGATCASTAALLWPMPFPPSTVYPLATAGPDYVGQRHGHLYGVPPAVGSAAYYSAVVPPPVAGHAGLAYGPYYAHSYAPFPGTAAGEEVGIAAFISSQYQAPRAVDPYWQPRRSTLVPLNPNTPSHVPFVGTPDGSYAMQYEHASLGPIYRD